MTSRDAQSTPDNRAGVAPGDYGALHVETGDGSRTAEDTERNIAHSSYRSYRLSLQAR